VIENGELRPKPFATVEVAARGEAGLMGIALPPDFATSREVYVVGTFDEAGALVNRVIRFTDDNGDGLTQTTILDNIPAAIFHAGDAIAFGPDGLLYVATGDARDPSNAQSDSSLGGKILRLRRDGTPPDDNPTRGSLAYANGVRNAQGITWLESGHLVATDHGPSGFPNEYFRRDRDELNQITAGSNQGWPTE
jgi:glucose/arabinose dehydrogenase